MRPRTELLANRYRLSSPIAGGGMGQVWRGQDTLLDRPVAVKVLRDQFAGDATFRARFRAEAQHAALLTHPHIAAVFDYGEVAAGADGTPLAYLVMELVEGESLADLLAREGHLDPARTVDILEQAADGLAAAHAAGVVHRDIKPANLLVTPQGVVKITDFGIARSAASVAVTGTGQVIGTAHYFSPEQAAGGVSTPASDVYALGTVGYECLAGRRPFEAENPVQIAVMHIRDMPPPLPPGVPAGVRALVERAMAKDPHARFPDGAALRDAAGRLAAGLPTALSRLPATAVLPVIGPGTAPMAAPTTAARGLRRWALPALAGMIAIVLAVTVLAVVLPERSDTPPADDVPGTTVPAGIEILAADHVGRQVRDVQADLVGRGLRVELVAVEAADVPAGQVTALDPGGILAPGDLVRLSYAVPPVPAPAPAPAPVPPPADPGEAGREDRGQTEEDEEERRDAEEEAREAEEERQEAEQEAEEEREEERDDARERRRERRGGGRD